MGALSILWGNLIIPQKPFNLFIGILRTNDKNQQLLCFQFFLYQKSSISKKASRHFVSRLSLSSLDIFSFSNRNQSSTKVKARMFFIVIPYDLVMSICHCTRPVNLSCFRLMQQCFKLRQVHFRDSSIRFQLFWDKTLLTEVHIPFSPILNKS